MLLTCCECVAVHQHAQRVANVLLTCCERVANVLQVSIDETACVLWSMPDGSLIAQGAPGLAGKSPGKLR